MTTDQISWRRVTLNVSAVLARWVLGAVFLYMGLNKALHPVDFLKLLRQYDIVAKLPAFEFDGRSPAVV